MDMPGASQVYKKEMVKAPERKRYSKKKKIKRNKYLFNVFFAKLCNRPEAFSQTALETSSCARGPLLI